MIDASFLVLMQDLWQPIETMNEISEPTVAADLSGCCLFRAICNYEPSHDGELPVKVGDIITSVKQLGNGWSLGKNRQKTGIFPSDIVVPLSVGSFPSLPEAIPKSELPENCNCHALRNVRYSGTGSREPVLENRYSGTGTREPARFAGTDARDAAAKRKQQVKKESPARVTRGNPRNIQTFQGRLHEIGNDTQMKSPHRLPTTNGDRWTASAVDVDCNRSLPNRRLEVATVWTDKPQLVVKPTQDTTTGSLGARSGKTLAASAAAEIYIGPHGNVRSDSSRRLLDRPDFIPSSRLSCNEPFRRNSLVWDSSFPGLAVRSSSPDLLPDQSCNNLTYSDSYDFCQERPVADDLDRCFPSSEHLGNRSKSSTAIGQSYTNCSVKYLPVLKSRKQRVADCNAQHVYYADSSSGSAASSTGRCRITCRIIGSILIGLLLGLATYLWMYYHLDYAIEVAGLTGLCVAVLMVIGLAVSRMVRCVTAMLGPSLCTARGRLTITIILFGFILSGPITNVHRNMSEIARSMSCSADQSLKQTMLLLEPFDEIMEQLNKTIFRLQDAAHNVSRGLKPLDDGLENVEIDVVKGKMQLVGTRRVSIIHPLINIPPNKYTP